MDPFDRNDLHGVPELHRGVRRGAEEPKQRSLGNNRNSYLVDENGVQYDPDSLAWRYLGLYIDCEDQNGSYCERKLLWAAYYDHRYRGNSIEEYQFYDLNTREWDDSTCSKYGLYKRCARMDCHEAGTGFKLVGVFKETDGMYDWTEQLFKHEGMCVWNDDETYNTMETWMETWPTSCQQLKIADNWGHTLYMAVKPTRGGNMTVAIYSDSYCTKESSKMDLTEYMVKLYQSKGYYDNTGWTVAETWKEAIATWNEKMSYFKTCQPCVAYNRFSEQTNNKREMKDRLLNNDGEGYERQRYNCYDDAGYTNVNQCYKFETKTNLKEASEMDLKTASSQGSILRIKAYGKVYGRGGYSTPMSHTTQVAYESLAVVATTGLALSVLYLRRCFQRMRHRRRRILPSSMNDVLCGGVDTDNAAKRARKSKKKVDRALTKRGKAAEKVQILENYIELKILGKVIADVNSATKLQHIEIIPMYIAPLMSTPPGSNNTPNEMNNQETLEDKNDSSKELGKAIADVHCATELQHIEIIPMNIAPPMRTPPESNNTPNEMNNQETLEDKIMIFNCTHNDIMNDQDTLKDQIISLGSDKSENSIHTEENSKSEEDVDQPPSIDQRGTIDASVSTVKNEYENTPVVKTQLSSIQEDGSFGAYSTTLSGLTFDGSKEGMDATKLDP
jgi:hypothetical protein